MEQLDNITKLLKIISDHIKLLLLKLNCVKRLNILIGYHNKKILEYTSYWYIQETKFGILY
jgi:hypothetical protein